MTHTAPKHSQLLEFMLEHFVDGFPRTVSSCLTDNAQLVKCNIQEAIDEFQKAEWIDARMNAYPVLRPGALHAPSHLLIDLDRSDFADQHKFGRALSQTLHNVKLELGGVPTVIWSGNGYHIHQPLDMPVLEQVRELAEFQNPSIKFLRYTEWRLTSGLSDPNHHVSFRSCMFRIPGSFNLKCIKSGKDPEVKVLQKWDGVRARPHLQFMKDFRSSLVKERMAELRTINRSISHPDSQILNRVAWIERLLEMPIEDYRKNAMALIISPYLLTVRKVPSDQACQILLEWLGRCNETRRLDFNPRQKVKEAIRAATKSKIPPMRIDTLAKNNKELHRRLVAAT